MFQLLSEFPTAFEYNEDFLIEIAHHSISLRFGTFLYNSERERREQEVMNKTASLWDFINANADRFANIFYDGSAAFLVPTLQMKSMRFWDSFYLRTHDWVQKRKERERSQARQILDWKRTLFSLQRENESLRLLRPSS